MERVTVYIPFKDSHETLISVIEAVARQTYAIDQVLLIDDGSSRELQIEKFSPDLNLSLIKHERNYGVAAARNTALRAVQSEFVLSFDADIVPEHDCAAELVAVLRAEPTVSGVGGRVTERYHDDIGDLFRSVYMKQDRGDQPLQQIDLFGGCTLYRTDALRCVGGYTETLRNSFEDFDISRRVQESGGATRYCPTARAQHIKRDTVRSALDTLYRWSYPHWESDQALASHDWFQSRIEYPQWYYERAVSSSIDTLSYKMKSDLALALGRIRDNSDSRLLVALLLYPVRATLQDLIFYRDCGGYDYQHVCSVTLDAVATVMRVQLPDDLYRIVAHASSDLLERLAPGKTWETTSAQGEGIEGLIRRLNASRSVSMPAEIFLEVFSEMLRLVSLREGDLKKACLEWKE